MPKQQSPDDRHRDTGGVTEGKHRNTHIGTLLESYPSAAEEHYAKTLKSERMIQLFERSTGRHATRA
jgi:hypothetical protein